MGNKNFPKNVRFITVAVNPRKVEQGRSSSSFYLTCLHLDHRYEPHRLKELDVIKRTLDSLTNKTEENYIPHIWVGDFNSLTMKDYTSENWKDIARVRDVNSWERPHVEVTNKVSYKA